MKAIQISENGGPEVLELKDISLDKPNAEEVTIEHKAIGLNYIDTYHRSGLYPLKNLKLGTEFLTPELLLDLTQHIETIL